MEKLDCAVFDETADSSLVESREHTRQSQKLHKEGYVEGLLRAEQDHNQEFFEKGFSAGYTACSSLASIRGTLRQLLGEQCQRLVQRAQRCIDSISQQENEVIASGELTQSAAYSQSEVNEIIQLLNDHITSTQSRSS